MNFNLISKKKRVRVLSGNIVLVVNQKIILEERAASHNALPTNSDARRRERRFALPHARRRKPLSFFGRAGYEDITLRVSWVGGGSPQASRAAQQR